MFGHNKIMLTDRQMIAQHAAHTLRVGMESVNRWKPLPHQIPPDPGFYGWLLLAGRGAGKTDTCAKYIVDHVKGPPCLPGDTPHWIGIIAPTLGDAVTSCVTGPSGIRAHDPSARMVTVQGGTVVRWPNGSEAKLFGAHTEDDTERLRSGGNRCIAQGTLIRTEHGLRPIEDVQAGDRVWTRNGLRRVLKTWDNGVRPVQRFDHGAGSTWLTPDHEVWTDRGWKQALSVQTTDTVLIWGNTESRSRTTESCGTPERMATTRTSIGDCYTDTCIPGRSDRSRRDNRSTTRTTTSATTESVTSYYSVPVNTGPNTVQSADPTGTARVERPCGDRQSTSPSSAIVAPQSSSPGAYLEPGSAPPDAERLRLRHGRGSNGCAACAVLSSSAPSGTRPEPVRESALQSTPMRSVVRVYDLTVEHDHEFFAGDLLVSNCLAWLEELSAWRYLDEAWDQMRFGLRSGPRPHWVGSTTPKPRPLIRKLDAGGINNTVITRATMYDNPHLPIDIREALEDAYGGTQLGRQELMGQLIDEDENALWNHRTLEAARVRPDQLPPLSKIAVGVDPSGGAGEQGIIVAGKSKLVLPPFVMPADSQAMKAPTAPRPRHHGYVLADRTCHLSPDGWGKRAVQAAIDFEADEIFAEINYGGAMCVSTLRTAAESLGVSIPIRTVTATRGKKVRAEPVSALTTQGCWHHAGVFPQLEDQLCTWVDGIGWSPDRLDAMVWTPWGMRLVHTAPAGQGSFGGALAKRQIVARR